MDRFGPRPLIATGRGADRTVLGARRAGGSLTMLYLTYGIIGGLGTGHRLCRRGRADGGLVPRSARLRRRRGRRWLWHGRHRHHVSDRQSLASVRSTSTALLEFGVIFGVVGLRRGARPEAPPAADEAAQDSVSTPTATMLKTPIFWLMFVMMSLMSTSGLMVTSQMATFGADFGITQMMVWGMAALPLALTVDRFTNGLTRPFFGWVSDRIGRENTMCLAFALEAVAMTLGWSRAATRCCSCCCRGWCFSAGARSSRCFPRR